MKIKFSYLIISFSFLCFHSSAQIDTTKNIAYAEADGKKLLLDLYMPGAKRNPYLIVWVHGGAWSGGSKEKPPLGLLPAGYALASINYRLSGEAPFPACIYDIKAAIRFLRGNAGKYGYRADKITIWGSSAGGHLVALAGVTNNDPYYEGNLGDYKKESSSIQAIIDFYGPSDFTTILTQSTPHGLSVRVPALTALLGKPVEQVPELARKASPVFHVDSTDPPLLIVHGDQDIQVPVNQSIELMEVYKKKKLPVQLEFIAGAGHGGAVYDTEEVLGIVKKFLADLFK
ncbi:MAG: alpha/beta hydrolase [Chitinophagaceae bacterium]